MKKKQIVWICCVGIDYEGYASPSAVFDSQEKAKKWIDEHRREGDYIDYFPLEVK